MCTVCTASVTLALNGLHPVFASASDYAANTGESRDQMCKQFQTGVHPLNKKPIIGQTISTLKLPFMNLFWL